MLLLQYLPKEGIDLKIIFLRVKLWRTKKEMDDCSRLAGEESPDTSPAIAGQAYGLTTRRGINNARGANRDAIARKS